MAGKIWSVNYLPAGQACLESEYENIMIEACSMICFFEVDVLEVQLNVQLYNEQSQHWVIYFFAFSIFYSNKNWKGLGKKQFSLSGVLSQNTFARFQYNPNWGTEVHVNPCQFVLSMPYMQVALADGQGKIIGTLQPQKITFWSWNEQEVGRRQFVRSLEIHIFRQKLINGT